MILLNLNEVLIKILFDQRFWYTAKSPFSHDGFNQISKDLSEMLFSILTKDLNV